jgi:hypothetical protein
MRLPLGPLDRTRWRRRGFLGVQWYVSREAGSRLALARAGDVREGEDAAVCSGMRADLFEVGEVLG